jgi:uncharacterized protein
MIRSVDDDGLTIGEKKYRESIALTTEEVFPDWTRKSLADLLPDDFSTLLALGPEIIILGTGPTSLFAPRELVFALARQNVGLEVMDTKAAARTFNVLAGEGRSVAAVLYL